MSTNLLRFAPLSMRQIGVRINPFAPSMPRPYTRGTSTVPKSLPLRYQPPQQTEQSLEHFDATPFMVDVSQPLISPNIVMFDEKEIPIEGDYYRFNTSDFVDVSLDDISNDLRTCTCRQCTCDVPSQSR